jgi:hypothetical protein
MIGEDETLHFIPPPKFVRVAGTSGYYDWENLKFTFEEGKGMSVKVGPCGEIRVCYCKQCVFTDFRFLKRLHFVGESDSIRRQNIINETISRHHKKSK